MEEDNNSNYMILSIHAIIVNNATSALRQFCCIINTMGVCSVYYLWLYATSNSTCGNIVATKIKGNYTSEASKLLMDV